MPGAANRRTPRTSSSPEHANDAGRAGSKKSPVGGEGLQALLPAASPEFPAVLAPGRDGGWNPGPAEVLALQRTVGNRQATRSLEASIQRVAVRGEKLGETLYNQSGTGGKAGAAHYSLTANYDIVRDGDAGATVTVRILYLNQSRNTTPKPAGAPPGTPDVGDLVGSPTEIPPATTGAPGPRK